MLKLDRQVIITRGLGFFVLGWVALCGQAAEAAHHEHRLGFHEGGVRNAKNDNDFANRIHRENARHAFDMGGRANGITDGGRARGTERYNSLVPGFAKQLRHASNKPSFQFIDNQRMVKLASGVDLDLNSQDRNIVLGQNLFQKTYSVEIEVGGETKTFSVGAQVTAAEYVAVKQVLGGYNQSVSINDSGQAIGGEVNLSALTERNDVMRAASLVVPVSVTAVGDFAKRSDFRLVGDLNNFGTVETLVSSGKSKGGTIAAENVTNHGGALITSEADLTLDASQNFTNDGRIMSSGNLSIQTQQLTNAGSLSAGKNVALTADSIKNGGEVVAHTGNIKIDSQEGSTGAFTIDNTNGTFSALNGAIEIHSPSYAGLQDTYVNGGNLLCSELNLNAGNGTVNVAVDQLTGTVSTTGLAAHIMASTYELTIGKTCLTGDPTFFNTAGSIAIVGNITVQEALTIVAAGDINLNNGSDLTAATTNQGFPITLIAGANFTNTGGANQTNLGPIPPNNVNNGSVTINGGSVTGGAINFNSSAGIDTFISTRPSGGTGDGADVLLVAFAGTGGTSGRVNTGLPTFDRIFTGGKAGGDNGSFTIIAPGINNGGTFLPEIDTSGGSGLAGNITITAANPIATNVIYSANGTLFSGKIIPSGILSATGEVRFVDTAAGNGTVTASGNLVQLSGNTNLTARKVNFSGGGINVFGDLTATLVFSVDSFGTVLTEFGATEGQVSSPISILSSTGGTIGQFGQEFLVTGGIVIADAAQGVNISSLGGINVAGGSCETGDFFVTGNGNTSITGDILVDVGFISVGTNSGALSASAVNLRTNNGNITLSNFGVDKKASKVLLTGTNVTALGSPGLGDVTISVGAPVGQVLGKAPKKNVNIDIQGTGQIFWGSKGLTTNAPTNNFSAKNANIFINNELSKKLIVLSGATLKADP